MIRLKHHKTLTREKWARFPMYKRILMIANELKRAQYWIERNEKAETRNCYERAMELHYLTAMTMREKNRLKEFMRIYEVLASFYLKELPEKRENEKLLKALLSLCPESFNLLKG